ncbi:MAG: M23 family metallopeptidase [Chloroflexota bacterium]
MKSIHDFIPDKWSYQTRRLLVLFLLLLSSSCNLPNQDAPVFIAPSGLQSLSINTTADVVDVPPTDVPETATPTSVQVSTSLSTPTPPVYPTITVEATATPRPVNDGPLLYYAQAGDTLDALAMRFGVDVDQIQSSETIPERGFINPNHLILIPQQFTNTTNSTHLLPDSELVNSLSSVGFDSSAFTAQAGGYLKHYHEYFGISGESYGGQIVGLIGLDNSINPRLLLALLEYQSGWVYGQPASLAAADYPLGKIELTQKGLVHQLKWAVNQLSVGYYGWREGRLNKIVFSDGVSAYLAPDLNAGTAALHYYFAQVYDSQRWLQAVDPDTGFIALYEEMFGNPWTRARDIEPLFPADLTQTDLSLPFLIGPIWSYTGGPHGAWEKDGSWAAIDFAPASTQSGCVESDAWVTASASGVVVRSERGIVVLDLDGDGLEQTGWVLIYLHITKNGRVPVGEIVAAGDLIGHPSCEGGYATGTHVHIARKYNGEWMEADGPIPFVLEGWQVHAGLAPYKGTLTRGDDIVTANQFGSYISKITRDRADE